MIGLPYIVLVGELLLTAIFLVAVVAGIRSLVWKVVWPVAAGCLWYFAGAFYAFELVLGGYTVAALAPVAAASLMAVLAAQLMNIEPFVIASTVGQTIEISGYLLYAVLGALCAGVGIAIIRLVASVEAVVRKLPIGDIWRPMIGGLFLIPVAWAAPQALSSGHGAMHLYMAQQAAVR